MRCQHIRNALLLSFVSLAAVPAQADRYPMLDMVSQRVIERYKSSTCQEIAVHKKAPPGDMEKRALELLRQDPQLRAEFLQKVAAPIVDKLFECGLIP